MSASVHAFPFAPNLPARRPANDTFRPGLTESELMADQYDVPTLEGAWSWRPGEFYFRKAIREACTLADAQEAGLLAVREYEKLKEWVRENQKLIPRKWFATREEATMKGF
jgi:hypothetical protein